MSDKKLQREGIDPHAFGIVKALQREGFTTYLVGGCVRDLLVGIQPKDFDIATMAHPPQVRKIIYNAYIIGKRFRLVLVKRDQQQFEVATFRAATEPQEVEEGEVATDNIFGTPEEDALRRDFTINGLFYDAVAEKLIDYTKGLEDIDRRFIRMIGEPNARLKEDPIRILRALRLAHKLGFSLDEELRAAIAHNASELGRSVLPRKREEILKILRLDEPDLVLIELLDLGLMEFVMPSLAKVLAAPDAVEIFFSHFRSYRRLAKYGADTVHLFAWLIFSMFQTLVDLGENLDVHRLFEDARFGYFMKEELGMYKFEQASVYNAIELLPVLSQVEEFRRKGERRQLHVLKNEGIHLALQLAEVDFLLPPEEIQFWRDSFEKAKDVIAAEKATEPKKRRRPRRRKLVNSPGRNEGSFVRPEDLNDANVDEELDPSGAEELELEVDDIEDDSDDRLKKMDSMANKNSSSH